MKRKKMNKQKTMKRMSLTIICLMVLSFICVDSNSLWAQETDVFVANTDKAVVQSSGWEKKDFSEIGRASCRERV